MLLSGCSGVLFESKQKGSTTGSLKLDAGEDIVVIDVRHSLDFEADPYIIPGALIIPLEQLESYPEVPRDREIVVYCS